MSTTTNTVRDRLIADAKDLPSLIAAAQTADPALAQVLTGKALVASKSAWGVPIAAVISWLVGRYGLGWDADTVAEISGAVVLVLSFLLRAITGTPITGFFKAAPVLLLVAMGGMLAACTQAQVAQTVATGQLVCSGLQGVVAVNDAAGNPVSVIGQSAAAVAAICKAVDATAVPTSPPANTNIAPATAPSSALVSDAGMSTKPVVAAPGRAA